MADTEIKVLPEDLRDAADFLTKEHEAIVTLVGNMAKVIKDTTAEWEGAAQIQFVESFTEQMEPALKESLPDVIEGISSQLKCTADTMEQTDESVSDALKNS